MIQKKALKTAFIKSIPILCSYIFVGIAYGIMMENAGFAWYYSLLASFGVYTGAFQFVLITLMSSGASMVTIALTALLMSSRQTFYSITFLKDFKSMGKRMLYMVLTMSDETYAVNCSLEMNYDKERKDIMFWVAMFSRIYWMAGSVIGQPRLHRHSADIRGSFYAVCNCFGIHPLKFIHSFDQNLCQNSFVSYQPLHSCIILCFQIGCFYRILQFCIQLISSFCVRQL